MYRGTRVLKTVILACLVVGTFAQQADATGIFLGPDGFVARLDQTYWKVPFDGSPATKLVVPTSKSFFEIGDMTYGGNTFMAFVPETWKTVLMYSQNGQTWTSKQGVTTGKYANSSLKSLFAVDGRLVGVLNNFADGVSSTCVSTDQGDHWQCDTVIPDAYTGDPTPVIECGGYLVANAMKSDETPSGLVRTRLLDFSKDGATWSQVKSPAGAGGKVFCANDEIWVAASTSNGQDLSVVSPKGIVQKGRIKGETLFAITGNGRAIFAYSEATYVSKDNGKTFARVAQKKPDGLIDAQPKYSNGMFVANIGRRLVQSRDGLTWTAVK